MPARDFSLTTSAAALADAVARPAKIAASKATVPILNHLLLRAERDGLSIVGTNTDSQATAYAQADVEETGLITVPAAAFDDVVSKFPSDGTVTLKADAAGMTLQVRCGRGRFRVASLDPDEFPEFAPTEMRTGFPFAIELAGKTLADLLPRVSFMIPKDEPRYYLCGAYCHVVAGDAGPRLRFVATDGTRLGWVETIHAAGLDPDMPGIIIPRVFVPELVKLAKAADDAMVTLEVSPTLVRLTAGSTSLASRLIDGTFPDYQRVIPTTHLREVRAPTLELLACVERVRVLAEGKAKAVRLSYRDGTMAVTLNRPHDLFQAIEEVDVDLTGDPDDTDFNGEYLAEMLKHIGDDTVRIRLNPGETAAVIGDAAGTALYVLMPLRRGSAGDARPEA